MLEVAAAVLEFAFQTLDLIPKCGDVGAIAVLCELVDVPGGLASWLLLWLRLRLRPWSIEMVRRWVPGIEAIEGHSSADAIRLARLRSL